MKVAIVGAGVQGSAIASVLTKVREVSEIVCSDIDYGRAERVARRLRNDRVRPAKVDADDPRDLLKVLGGPDVVINATLPKFNLKVMEFALESGANYVALASDDPLEELELNRDWARAGLTAVSYQGGPFVMNVLVKRASERMDRVDEIRLRFGWKRFGLEGEVIPVWRPSWCPEVALTEWMKKPAIYESGKLSRVQAFSGMEDYEFPALGSVTVCFVDYEPVYTLPRFIGKGVRRVDCKIPPDLMAGALIKMGFGSEEPIEVKGVKVAPRDVLLALIRHPADLEQSEGEVRYCFLAEVGGVEKGRRSTHVLYRTASTSEDVEKFGTRWAHVAIPAVATAIMLWKGEVETKGVIPPEGLDPDHFLAKLAEWGMTFQEIRK